MEARSPINIAFLHGFGGNRLDFQELQSLLPSTVKSYNLSIAGHEKTPPPSSLTEEIQRLLKEIQSLQIQGPLILCGYSLGGRLASLIAEKISLQGLILLSSGMGEEKEEQLTRLKKDQDWAKLLKENHESFFCKWYKQALFKSLEKLSYSKKEAWLKTKDLHHPDDLALALEHLSPAQHKDLRPLLKNQRNVLYLAGALDQKYARLAVNLKNDLPHIQVEVLPGVGHILPLEAPAACAQIISNWLVQLSH